MKSVQARPTPLLPTPGQARVKDLGASVKVITAGPDGYRVAEPAQPATPLP